MATSPRSVFCAQPAACNHKAHQHGNKMHSLGVLVLALTCATCGAKEGAPLLCLPGQWTSFSHTQDKRMLQLLRLREAL